jgi:hypothetical protein
MYKLMNLKSKVVYWLIPFDLNVKEILNETKMQ